MTDKRPRTLFTDDQKRKAELLSHCTFLPASYDKRFARNIHAEAVDPDGGLTEKQAALLERMYYRYRRQISNMGGVIPPFVEPPKQEKPPSHDALVKLQEWKDAVTPKVDQPQDEQLKLFLE